MTNNEAIGNLRHAARWNDMPKKEALDMAIEALEQKPCEDCVSREELLKAIDTWDKFGCGADTKLVPYKDHYIPYVHYDDVVKCIKGMPSVTPKEKTGWILVSERLPDKNGRYLVTVKQGYITFGEWVDEAKNWANVIAWMPLPEPYKAESEE